MMLTNRSKLLLMMSIVMIMLIGLSSVNATNDTSTYSLDESTITSSQTSINTTIQSNNQIDTTQSTSNNNYKQSTVNTTIKTISNNSKDNTEVASNDNTKSNYTLLQNVTKNNAVNSTDNLNNLSGVTTSVVKNSNKTLLKQSAEITVNNYNELYQAIEDAKLNTVDTEYKINLNDNGNQYIMTAPIIWGNATGTVHNLTINGNGQILNTSGIICNNYISVYKEYNLTLDNLTFSGSDKSNSFPIQNNGTLNIVNSNISDIDDLHKNLLSNYGNLSLNNSILSNIHNITTNLQLLYCLGASDVHLNNCSFVNNSANTLGYSAGGKIYFNNTSFYDNRVGSCNYCYGASSYGYFDFCTFINNTGRSIGSCIRVNQAMTAKINNCTFIGNKGSQGAIYMYTTAGANRNASIIDCTFINNTASGGGGAVVLDRNNNISVINALFLNNSGVNGGALYAISNSNTILDNVTMINNNATTSGGAIRTNGGKVLIINSLLSNNTITKGEGIQLYLHSNTTIINTTITNTTVNAAVTNGIIVVNAYQFNMTNSTVSNNNANNGVICSNTASVISNSSFINNSAVNGAVAISTNVFDFSNNFVLGNVVTGDNSFIISASSANSVIDNNTFINNTDGNLDMLLKLNNAESVSGNIYVGNMLNDSFIGINNVTISEGSNYNNIILFNLRDVYNDTVRNGTIYIVLNGVDYGTLNVVNATANISIPYNQLVIGINNITLNYVSNDKSYQPLTDSFTVTINKESSYIAVDVNDVYVNNTLQINSTLTGYDNSPLKGQNITLVINGVNHTLITDNNGKVSYNFISQTNGTVDVMAIFNGSERNLNSNNSVSFVVKKIPVTVNINTIPNIYVNQTILINMTVVDVLGNNVTGIINITGIDGVNYTVNVINGVAQYSFTPNASGNYTFNVRFNESNYYLGDNNTCNVTVNKVPTRVTINNAPLKVGVTSTLNITVTDILNNKNITDGNLVILINGTDYSNNLVTDGDHYVLNYTPNNNGTLPINITYNGNLIYDSSVNNIAIDVTKISTVLSYDPSSILNLPVGNTSTIKVNVVDNETGNIVKEGNVTLDINGTILTTNVINGVATFNYTPQVEGVYTINAVYNENYKYYNSTTGFKLQAFMLDTNIKLVAGNNTWVNHKTNNTIYLFEINTGNPISGNVTVFVGGVPYTVEVINGTISYEVIASHVGEVNITVVYNGTNRYHGSSASGIYTNIKIPTNVELDGIYNLTVNTPVDLIFNVTEMGTDTQVPLGNVTLNINGQLINASVVNGIVNVTYTPTSEGVLNVSIKYHSNENYTDSSNSYSLNSTKKRVNINIVTQEDIIVNHLTNGTIFLTDLLDNNVTKGTVNITINGVTTEYTVVDSKVTFNYTPTSTGELLIKVTYNENDEYISNQANHTITVKPITTSITLNPTIIVSGIPSNITVNVTEEGTTTPVINGTIIFNIEGVNYTANVINGVAIIPDVIVNGSGNPNVTVIYKGNTYYTNTNITSSITVIKLNTNIIINVPTMYANKTYTVPVYVNDVNGTRVNGGNITVVIDGVSKVYTLNENGTCNITIHHEASGTYTSNLIYYNGTVTYLNSTQGIELTFNKIPVSITLNNISTIIVGNNQEFNFNFTDKIDNSPVISGNANVIITDSNNLIIYNNTLNVINGSIKFNHVFTSNGTYNVKVIYNGNIVYQLTTNNRDLQVITRNTNITVNIPNLYVNNTQTITFNVTDTINNTPVHDGNIIFTIEGVEHIIPVINGIATYNYTPTINGTNNIIFQYNGTNTYAPSNTNKLVTVLKSNTNIIKNNTSDSQLELNKEHEFVYNITYNNEYTTGKINSTNIQVYINGVYYNTTSSTNGTISFNYTPTNIGSLNITVYYPETNTYKTYNYTSNYEVYNPIHLTNTTITTNTTNIHVYDNVTVIITVVDVNGTLVNEGNVTVTVNGINSILNITNGVATFVYQPLNTDRIIINAIYPGTSNYYASKATTVTLNVNQLNTVINATITNNTVGNTTIKVNVTDSNGELVSNGTVIITDPNGTVIGTLNITNGIANGTINATVGDYNITVTYNGTDNYNKTNTTIPITVNKHNSTVSVNNITDTTLNKNTNITGTLVDEQGRPIPNQTITITINGINYTTKTDNNGKYNLTYLITSVGQNNVTITYNGNENYTSTKTNTTFVVNKLNTTINATITNNTVGNTTIKVNVTDSNGELVSNGTVIITDPNGTVIGTLNITNGIANGTINTTVGTYNITVTYNGTDNYNKTNTTIPITVNKHNSTVSVNNITDVTLNKNTNITGTLVDEQGRPIPNQTVTITVNGVNYTTVTNSTGGYNLTYLITSVGQNNVTITYNGNENYTSTKTNTTFVVNKLNTTINATITNNTVGNTTIKVNVTDSNGELVSNGTVIITDPNGTVIGTLNITNGIANGTINTTVGTYNITVTYNGTDNYNKTNTTIPITVNKHNSTVSVNNITDVTLNKNTNITGTLVDEQGRPIPNQTVTITVNGVNYTTVTNSTGGYNLTYLITSVGQNNVTITYNGNENYTSTKTNTTFVVNKLNTTINATITNNTVGNTTIKVNVTDSNGELVSNGTVIITDPNGTVIGTLNITNGIANGTINTTVGTYNITVTYNGTDNYNKTNTTIPISVNKLNTIVVVDPVSGMVGDNVTLTATIKDEFGNLVDGGKIVFKINNETLKDSYGNPICVYVHNGIAKLNYTLTCTWVKDNITISAVYGGTNSKYLSSRSTKEPIKVVKRDAIINITTSHKVAVGNDTVKFTAIIYDKYTHKLVTTGKVVFKFQGHTICDKNGNPIVVNIVNGVATLNYTLPFGISSHNYTITAVYSNEDYNRAENSTKQFVNKTKTTINLNPIKTNNTQITITGTIKDTLNESVKGTNKIAIKVNGITLKDKNNQTIYYNITNGKINITIPNNYKNINNITIVTGERLGYYGSTNTTTNINKTNKTSTNTTIKT